MKPLKLQLTDWCQHEQLELLFVEGMNSLQGRNGSGKTNLLEALNLCLSQDTNSPGKKTDNIRNGCEKARLMMVFEHEGVEGTIEVQLSRNYRKSWDELAMEIALAENAVAANQSDPTSPVSAEELRLANFKPRETVKFSFKWADLSGRTAGEVAEFIRTRTLLDPRVIRSNYFPRQGDVDGAMSADKETRQRIFHEKAGTALCQKVWEELGRCSSSLQNVGQVDDQLKEVETRLAVAEGELKTATEAFEAAKLLPQDPAEPSEIVRRYMSAKQIQSTLLTQQAELSSLVEREQQLSATCDQLAAQGIKLRLQFDEQAPLADSTRQKLWQSSQDKTLAQARQKLLTEVEDLRTKRASLVPPEERDVQAEQATVEQLQKDASLAEARAAELDRWLKTFQGGACPTCGAPVDAQVSKRYEEELLNLQPLHRQQEAQKARSSLQAYLQASQAYSSKVAQLETLLASKEQQLAAAPEGNPLSDHEVADLEQWLNAFELLKRELEQLRQQHSRSYHEFQQVSTQRSVLQERIQGLLSGGTGDCPTEQEFRQATELVQQIQFNQQQLRDTQVALLVATKRREDLQNDLVRLNAEASKVGPVREWSSMLLRARELFHRNALPSEVVAWYAQMLAERTQTYLDMFEAGFQLAVSRELDLLGIFPDKVIPASRFSGGQKNMVNISMRLAMIDLFPSHLNLLVLDEVEVHLDNDKVACLPILLERVKGLARNRGLVVLFISHHPSLTDISDHLISLAA